MTRLAKNSTANSETTTAEAAFAVQRAEMVREQIVRRGVGDQAVIAAMSNVPRHEFVPVPLRSEAYADHPLPIGAGQTISQPYMVALMAQMAAIPPDGRVLEVGTGCGYQAAILAQLSREVFSLEIVPELARAARETCERLGYRNITLGVADGSEGWPEYAPFDAIVVAAAPEVVPPSLLAQLKKGGHLVLPLGRDRQRLTLIMREEGGFRAEESLPVRFVPMVRVAGLGPC
jgi:protein-L-isoaspartate(D-aspartate) O-methyltransferase